MIDKHGSRSMNIDHSMSAQLKETATLLQEDAEMLTAEVARGARLLADGLLHDGKIFVAGHGSRNSLALYFTTLMIYRFETERPALPAMALASDSTLTTTFAGENRLADLYSSQIFSLGQDGDLLLLLHGPEHAGYLGQWLDAAHQREMTCVLLGGTIGEEIRSRLHERDTTICIESDSGARILEIQLPLIHILCNLIDRYLLGPN